MASRKCRLDTLSQDILDEDFVKVFQPAHFLSQILGLLRVDVQHKFVTPPSSRYQIYSCIVRFVDILTAIEYVLNCQTIFDGTLTDLFLKAGTIGMKIGNAAVAWRNMFVDGRQNTQLFVKLQKMDRGLIPTKTYLNRKLAERTSKITVVAAGLSVLMVISYLVLIPTDHCSRLGLAVTSTLNLGLYSEIILSIITIYYVGIRVEYLNKVLEKEANRYERKNKVYKSVWRVGDSGSHCSVKFSDELVKNLYSVLDVITNWLSLFQYPIFNFMVAVLGTDLIVVQSFVTALRQQKDEYRPSLYLSPMLLFTALQVALCLLAGSVSSKLDTTRKLCNHIAYSRPQGKIREVAKRMITLLNARRDLTVYNIFTLNSSLPLNLLGIVTSYAIVLFQFALL